MKKDPMLRVLVLLSIAAFSLSVFMMYAERNTYGPSRFVPASVELVIARQTQDEGDRTDSTAEALTGDAIFEEPQDPPVGQGRQEGITAPVNINTAGLDELTTLPGIGPVIAQNIIDYRERVGGFTSVEQLIYVERIGQKTLEKIRPLITID